MVLIIAGCGKTSIDQNAVVKSPFDEEALFVAVKKNNPKYCEKITTKEAREECQQKISDQKMYYEKNCEKIQTQQLKDLCTEQLKDEKEEVEKQKVLREKEEKEIEKEAQIESSGNIKDCDTLDQDHLKVQCQLNIAANG